MAFIKQEEIKPFIGLGMTNYRAWKELAAISRELRLKRNETGFSTEQMKNFAIFGYTCSPETREAILSYFRGRAEELKKKLEKL